MQNFLIGVPFAMARSAITGSLLGIDPALMAGISLAEYILRESTVSYLPKFAIDLKATTVPNMYPALYSYTISCTVAIACSILGIGSIRFTMGTLAALALNSVFQTYVTNLLAQKDLQTATIYQRNSSSISRGIIYGWNPIAWAFINLGQASFRDTPDTPNVSYIRRALTVNVTHYPNPTTSDKFIFETETLIKSTITKVLIASVLNTFGIIKMPNAAILTISALALTAVSIGNEYSKAHRLA